MQEVPKNKLGVSMLTARVREESSRGRTRVLTHIPADEVIVVVVVDHPPGRYPHRVPLPEVVAPKRLHCLAYIPGDAWTDAVE